MDAQVTAQLVERAKDGDEAAFERLYHLHGRRVYALCLRMTSNVAEAEDLTQEAFLQAFRKVNTFRGEASFSTWIYRITTNVVLMRRRRKTHPEVSLEDATAQNGVTAGVAKFVRHADPAGKLLAKLSLHWAIDQLPEGYRNVFVLHDIQGYEHNEIAKLTGRSIGNSKSQLHKARERLRQLLAPERHAVRMRTRRL